MKQDGDTKKKRDRLEEMLNTFGADQNRWPAAERTELENYVKTNKSARTMCAEAKALAKVMDAAPVLRASPALSERIVSAALDDTAREATIVPLALKSRQAERPFSLLRSASIWPAAALAASFAFGLYMGVAGIGGTAVEGVFQIAMTEISATDADSFSWLEDSAGGDEEGLR